MEIALCRKPNQINDLGKHFFPSDQDHISPEISSEPPLTLIRLSKWVFLFVCSVTEFSHRYLSYSRCCQMLYFRQVWAFQKTLFDSTPSTILYCANVKITFYILMTFSCLLLLCISFTIIDGATLVCWSNFHGFSILMFFWELKKLLSIILPHLLFY